MFPERVIVLSLPGFEAPAPGAEEPPDFGPVFARLTNVVPQIEVVRPGLVVMGARGPARYYGGEREAARELTEFARTEGIEDARVGIADGRFTATLAALRPRECTIIDPGASPEFLRNIPIALIGDERLGEVLPGLGIYTLGAFAALPEDAVSARFGPGGVRAHRHARGKDADRYEAVRPHAPQQDFEVVVAFETPLAGAEQLAFACSTLTERLSTMLTDAGLVCTTLRITLTDDVGARHEREWAHPKFFTAADMLARLRWQADALSSGGVNGRAGERTGAGVESVRLFPTRTARTSTLEPGLWSPGIDDRVHHHVSRAQSLLGPAGVGTVSLDGGRLLRDRQRFTPWGVAVRSARSVGPWPGALPAPAPSLVFTPPLRATLCDIHGALIRIDADDLLTSTPATLRVEHHETPGRVRGWSRPWPVREHWWAGRPSRFRVQLELDDGDAWVLLAQLAQGHPLGSSVQWFAEGRYD